MTLVIAHRGWSGLRPEQTRAAYDAAVDLAERTGARIGLECDVHFSADGQLICLHDLDLARTGGVAIPAVELTVARLKEIDVGSWFLGPRPSGGGPSGSSAPDPAREVLTLDELFDLVAAARNRGVDVVAVVETKHPNPRGHAVEEALIGKLRERGWTGADAPVRMISFDPEAVAILARELPDLPRSQLEFPAVWLDGVAAPAISPWLGMIRREPERVTRAHEAGLEVHVWTVNEPADIDYCVEIGVDAITSDHPDRVLARLASRL